MTEKQKKIAIIAGTVILAILILLWRKGAMGGTTIVNREGGGLDQVSVPGFTMPERSPIAINIPELPSFTPYQYSAISPCMCNGADLSNSGSYDGPLVTFTINQGNAGASIYDYGTTVDSDFYPQFATIH